MSPKVIQTVADHTPGATYLWNIRLELDTTHPLLQRVSLYVDGQIKEICIHKVRTIYYFVACSDDMAISWEAYLGCLLAS
jgi:hypothetical protein